MGWALVKTLALLLLLLLALLYGLEVSAHDLSGDANAEGNANALREFEEHQRAHEEERFFNDLLQAAFLFVGLIVAVLVVGLLFASKYKAPKK